MVSSATPDAAKRERLYSLITGVFRGGLAGVLAGVVFLGFGSRAVMRISALLNPDEEGALTENGNFVGDITLVGTAELVLFAGVAGGLAAGTVWVLVRDWLPQDQAMRALLAGGLAAVTGHVGAIGARNRDFFILDPPEAHIAMFILCIGLAGAATPVLDDRLKTALPSSPRLVMLYGALAAAGVALAVPILFVLYFLNGETERSPWPLGAALVPLAVATVAGWLSYVARGEAVTGAPAWQRGLATASLLFLAVFGAGHLAGEIDAIL